MSFSSPVDWQEVGCRHAIRFTWPGKGEPPAVEFYDKPAFVRWMQAENAGPSPLPRATIRARRLADGECLAEPQVDLPVGDGVLVLRAAVSGTIAAATGIRVMAGADAWSTTFPRLLSARLALLPFRRRPVTAADGVPVFSVTTTVYDTEPRFLDELFSCMREQAFADFEWLVLDNGSARADVRQQLLEFAARDGRVRHFRVEQNIHIIPGNRYLLERARGRYIVPIDSDDLIYPDALAILAERLVQDAPTILFSEETKVTHDGVPAEYVWRPEFSRLAALSTCPASHLMAFDRERALACDVYGDDYAKGSHDWDTFMRLTLAGGRALRVPDVLYGWRMHPASSSVNLGSKDYLLASQRGVLEHSVRRLGMVDRFLVEPTEPGGLGYYHLARRHVAPRLIAVDFVLRGLGADELRTLAHNLERLDYPDLLVRVLLPEAAGDESCSRLLEVVRGRSVVVDAVTYGNSGAGALVSQVPGGAVLKLVVDGSLRIDGPEWLWDCLGSFELDADLAVVGGRVLDAGGRIQHIGYFAGLDGFVATPCHGQAPGSVYGQRAYFRRHVTAVYGGLLAVRADVFARVGPLLDVDGDDGMFGVEFCMRCADAGFGIAFSPRLSAVRDQPLQHPPGHGAPLRELLAQRHPRLLATDPYYSALLCASAAHFGVNGHVATASAAVEPMPFLQQLVRGAAIAANTARDRTRTIVRKALEFLRGAPAWRGAVGTLERTTASAVVAPTGTWLPPTGLCTPADPLNLTVDPNLADRPCLNVLLPVIGMKSMSGGPNTVFNLAYRMAAAGGLRLRFVSTSGPLDANLEPVWAHLQSLSGVSRRLPDVEFVDAHDRNRPVAIGVGDVFMASAWWTAQMVKYALPLLRSSRFLYVIQDFEPVLHEHSSLHAMALETYELDCMPIINHALLRDYLCQHAIGRFREPDFAARAIVIDPAIDRSRFHCEEPRAGGPRRLLFYARPNSARRNLFELGVGALQRAVVLGAFDAEPWEFLAMGDPVPEIALGRGHVLRPAPWRDFDGYAAQMRQADLLLSPMLSPHPSYPPLEMAACGGLVVTTAYDCKTAARMKELSANILAVPATIDGMSDGLIAAAAQVGDLAARRRAAALRSPPTWEESFAHVIPAALAALEECRRQS